MRKLRLLPVLEESAMIITLCIQLLLLAIQLVCLWQLYKGKPELIPGFSIWGSLPNILVMLIGRALT